MQPQLKPINDQVPRLSDNIPSFESVIGQRPALVGSQFEWMVGKDGGGATRAQFHDLRIATYAMPTDCEGRHKLVGANGTRMASPCFFEEHRDACPPGVIGHEQALPVRPIHRIAPVAGSDDTPELLVVDALQFAGRLMPVAHRGFNTIKGAESGQACPGQHPADGGLVHAHAALPHATAAQFNDQQSLGGTGVSTWSHFLAVGGIAVSPAPRPPSATSRTLCRRRAKVGRAC